MYRLIKTDEYWSTGGSATDVKLFKKASRKSFLTRFLKSEFEKAMEDDEIEFINDCEKCCIDVEDIEDDLMFQFVSEGIGWRRTRYSIVSDEEVERISMMLKYDIENDSEKELIRKALNNEQLYVCIADKDYIIYVIKEYEFEANEKAYEYYCDTCFEPGHWNCFKADFEEDEYEEIENYDTLLYDEDDLNDFNEMVEMGLM